MFHVYYVLCVIFHVSNKHKIHLSKVKIGGKKKKKKKKKSNKNTPPKKKKVKNVFRDVFNRKENKTKQNYTKTNT